MTVTWSRWRPEQRVSFIYLLTIFFTSGIHEYLNVCLHIILKLPVVFLPFKNVFKILGTKEIALPVKCWWHKDQ